MPLFFRLDKNYFPVIKINSPVIKILPLDSFRKRFVFMFPMLYELLFSFYLIFGEVEK